MFDLAIVNGKVYLNGSFVDVNLYIRKGKIWDVSSSVLESKDVYDAKGRFVLPGFIDPHVHFKLKVGRFESVDDFESGSISCAFGGITTFIDFLDPIKNSRELEKAFESRIKLARDSFVDYSFHTTVANPEDPLEIVRRSKEFGISSVKLFTTYSSTDRMTPDDKIKILMENTKRYGFVLSIHAENDMLVKESEREDLKISDYPDSRPTISELSEVVKLAQMSEYYDSQTYIVHVSSGKTLLEMRKRYRDVVNRNLVMESCPHYFIFNKEILKKDGGALYAMCPPLRSEEERILLNDEFEMVRTVGTDHCSFMRKEKLKEFAKDVPMGIGGAEFSFVVMYSLFGDEIIDKFTSNVADLFGLKSKGRILPGKDADLVVFDPSQEWEIKEDHSKSDYNPYEGFKVKGRIISTIVRGKFVVKDGKLVGRKGYGTFLRRGDVSW